ncbi:AAA family ATPase [Pararhizobium sp. A13]|uniref:AAA family ATPase n=1 Tax=Pararhizobium sp. A13 TaxID=3133975 RepID=UPI00324AE20A
MAKDHSVMTRVPDDISSVIKKLQELAAEERGIFMSTVLILKRKSALIALVKSARNFVAYCAFVRFVRQHRSAFSAPAFAIIVSVPKTWRLGDVQSAAATAFGYNREVKLLCHHHGRNKKGEWEIDATEYLMAAKLVILKHDETSPHPDFVIAATADLRLEIGLASHFRALSSLLKCGEISDDALALIAKEPAERIDALFRIGQPVEVAAARLKKDEPVAAPSSETLSLRTNKGFGPASSWAIQLQRDLAEWRCGKLPWSEVDRGILLFGPPGTGKTRFAMALARECEMHLISTSISRWQSSRDGHLGDLLKAMYGSFAEAKSNAPCLLFLDEIDSIGDRKQFNSRYKDYSVQVVNGLLESLDGVDSREGVIVMGACNHPERIDPAVLRSGRLEKHVHFPLPDADTRADILQFYLPSLAAEPKLKAIASRLVGFSGADLERLARHAKRTARTNNRDIALTDVEEHLQAPQILDDASLFRVAVHEVGHAILAHALDVGVVTAVEVYDQRESHPTERAAHGITFIEQPLRGFRTKNGILNNIAMSLGGLAAEEVILDDRSTSSGGAKGSDLELATSMAIEMCGEYGLDNSLFFVPGAYDTTDPSSIARDPSFRAEVNVILQREFRRAKEHLNSRKEEVLAFALALKKEKRIDGLRLEYFLQQKGSDRPGKQNA